MRTQIRTITITALLLAGCDLSRLPLPTGTTCDDASITTTETGTDTGTGSETDTGTDTSTDTSTDAPAVCCSCDPLDCQPWTFSEQVCEVDQSNAQGEPLVWCELSVFGSPLECEAECNAM